MKAFYNANQISNLYFDFWSTSTFYLASLTSIVEVLPASKYIKGASFELRLEVEICTANLKDNMEDKNFNITWINQESNSYSDLPDPALAHLMTFIGLTLLTVGFVVHKAVYQLLNRFSNRYINQIIYPYTVRLFKNNVLFQK